jgi:3-oxoadipate enol-lactonase
MARLIADAEMPPRLPELTARCLILAGRFDHVRPPNGLDVVAGSIPSAGLEVIDSGHLMATQTPGIVADFVENFFGSADAASFQT